MVMVSAEASDAWTAGWLDATGSSSYNIIFICTKLQPAAPLPRPGQEQQLGDWVRDCLALALALVE